jgi:uncharacterized protein (DUF924 family)
MKSAAILDYWLGPEATRDDPPAEVRKRWFEKSPMTDAYIAEHFSTLIASAAIGALDSWADTARGRLALIILLDQFTRNVHRDNPRAFDHDHKALSLVHGGLELGQDKELAAAERQFFYMPLMHSEVLAEQRRSVALFDALAHDAPALDSREWAKKHCAIIERFGRFPHRNNLLGRTSTGDEVAFLMQPGSSF